MLLKVRSLFNEFMATCTHCDNLVQEAVFDGTDDSSHERPFCCEGCLTVYRVLRNNGLGQYYELKSSGGILRPRGQVRIGRNHFKYLDDPTFLNEFTQINGRGEREMGFYLEGIHCLGCLWVIEKLPELVPGVLIAKLDIESSVVHVDLLPQTHLEDVASMLVELGYRPHPLKRNQAVERLKANEEKWQLLRIGVAAAGASNIMIYAVSIYAGASGVYAQVFNALTVLFGLPVLVFSAWPFYKQAWISVRNRSISIDVPISVALICGTFMGLYDFFSGVSENYFDSLTALVFLLLLSRYFLKRLQDQALAARDLHFFYHNDSVERAVDQAGELFQEIHPGYLKIQDVIRIRENEFVPADGTILRGEGKINAAMLTGESKPQSVSHGGSVFAGTQLVRGTLIVRVDAVSDETRLGKILKKVESGWTQKAPIVELTQKVSRYFLWSVFILAIILFVKTALIFGWHKGLESAITLLIVTCPCALALAIPLTFTRALGLAARRGMVIKNDAVLERLSRVRRVFFDKTGTLTEGRPVITSFRIIDSTPAPIADIVLSLEKSSHHPVGVALCEYARKHAAVIHEVQDHEEIIGRGVSGFIHGHLYEIHSYQLFCDGRVVASFSTQDSLRTDASKTTDKLRTAGLEINILSGDRGDVVRSMAEELGIDAIRTYAGIGPEEKGRIVAAREHAMMVGDGSNDAIALSQASVGVAICGSTDISLRAGDVYLLSPGIEKVSELLEISTQTMKVIRRNLVLSLAYNSLSVAAAFAGIISPLVAAIIMPVSSLTVLLSTLWGTRKMRQAWK